ncbi:MAG: hypothetical protein K1Y02_25160 [Candidatus Hydrogenedentes bacterium]|nr:hypothetical protein [Candidatus Hydrogenedentota bacterium]
MKHPFYGEHMHRVLGRFGYSEQAIEEYAALKTRTTFANRFFSDARGRPWTPRPYQFESLESRQKRKVHCDGRDVGKTAEIEITACWASMLRPNSQMLIATQCENHLFPLMERLTRRFTTTPVFSGHLVEIRRSPSWFLRFDNGSVLWGRIAGPHGMNFQGLHVDWQIIDEAQEMTETAWGELYQALNGGGSRWVYGVPNGLRNTFYRMTQMPDMETYNWPSSWNPEFSAKKDDELARLYGGKNSPGYIHRVLGQHGSPMHAVFDLDHYLACVDDGLDFLDVHLTEGDAFDLSEAPKGVYYLGCDLGYARDPSEFVVYLSEPPHLINVARIHLEGVNYARQQEIIVQLDRAYAFRSIGIDAGNNGRAIAHNLMNRSWEWCDKIRAFEFGGLTDLGELPNGSPDRRPTKALMTELIQRHMLDRSIVFPHLPDRESQYASHTYSVGQMGQILFEKGDDHLIDADRCAVLAHHLDTFEHFNPRPPLPLMFDTF